MTESTTKERKEVTNKPVKVPINGSTGPAIAAILTTIETIVKSNKPFYLPVPVDDIAEALGLVIQSLPLSEGLDGMLIKNKAYEPFKAVSNSRQAHVRQRFTLAHEIGHYVRKYQDWPDDTPTGEAEHRDQVSAIGWDPDEMWANEFAANLLMPTATVERYWAAGMSEADMADIFDVSVVAMHNRRLNLHLTDE